MSKITTKTTLQLPSNSAVGLTPTKGSTARHYTDSSGRDFSKSGAESYRAQHVTNPATGEKFKNIQEFRAAQQAERGGKDIAAVKAREGKTKELAYEKSALQHKTQERGTAKVEVLSATDSSKYWDRSAAGKLELGREIANKIATAPDNATVRVYLTTYVNGRSGEREVTSTKYFSAEAVVDMVAAAGGDFFKAITDEIDNSKGYDENGTGALQGVRVSIQH
jgi:hypothetical protein